MKQICIIDDDTEIVRILTAVLESDGYTVLSANNAVTGWELISKNKPTIALIDWQMPVMSGVELIKRIKADPLLTATYVIMVSARTETNDIVHGLDAGADEYLPKPFKLNELSARLRSGLRIRELEEQIAEESQQRASCETVFSLTERISSPIAAARQLSEALLEHPAVHTNAKLVERMTMLNNKLKEAIELIYTLQSLQPPHSASTPGSKTVINSGTTPH